MSQVEPAALIPVGVVVERRRAKSQWAHFMWRAVAVLAGVPEAKPWTVLDDQADHTTYFAGTAEVALYRSDCGNYRINLTSATPQLWVILRDTGSDPPYKVAAVTADPGEAEAFTDSGADLVESVPMPESICTTVAAFVAAHHGDDEVFAKRQRDRADPEALARRAAAKDRK